jgi:putative photosynthetic complex assembly protein 2
MIVATVVLGVSLHGLAATSADTSVTGAYLAFGFALAAWGWNEMGFLMGIITGPRDTAMPEGATGLRRLGYAIQAVIHHEIAIALTAFAIIVAVGDGPNQVGVWTFVALWVMRLSAKINVYLGVPNITEEFLPPHLVYLKTYFRIRPMNAMFPISITLLTLAAVSICNQARLPGATPYDVTAATLLATLVVLALVEHWFMVLPIPSTKLWEWGLTSHTARAQAAGVVPGVVDPSATIPTVLAPTPAMLASFLEATGAVGLRTDRAVDGGSVKSVSPAALSTIVPFPTPAQTTHRRRP